MTKKKEEVVEEEEKTEEAPEEELKGYLRNLKDGPTEKQIELWKAQHKEVYVLGFSETELYVWRPVLRGEYSTLQEQAQKEGLDQNQSELMLADMCKLYPGTVDWEKGKAGTISTLVEQIMLRSNFLAPQHAAMLVTQL
jgi:hypothetical protein